MTTEERQVLYDRLMEGAPEELVMNYERWSNQCLDALEPVIDRMLEAARDPQNHIDVHSLGLDVLPDGENVIIDGAVAGLPRGYRFTLTMARPRLRSLAMFLIGESFKR